MANEELTCVTYSAFKGFIPLADSLIRTEGQRPPTFIAKTFKDHSWRFVLKIVIVQIIDIYIHAFSS